MSGAEQVMIAQLRQTIALDHGRVRQIFDIRNCPGMVKICDLSDAGCDGEFETVSEHFELTGVGLTFEDADEALLAWDSRQTDHEIADALGHVLLRYRHGLALRPLWDDRNGKQKSLWIAQARSFRALLNSLGFDLVRMEPK